MKKRAFIVSIIMMMATVMLVAQAPKPKAKKYPVPGHKTAFILVTEVLLSDNYGEFRIRYEENADVFDDVKAEKELFEFISKYKVEHKYSTVSVEDLKAQDTVGKRTSVLKRVVFEQVNKRRKK